MNNNILLLSIFLYNCLIYAQQDTIVIHKDKIVSVEEDVYTKNPRTGVYRTRYYAQKGSKDSLSGFYKVIEDEAHFYTCYFQRGLKSLNKEPFYNFVKYYKKNRRDSVYQIYKIDLYFPYHFTNQIYYRVNKFNCKAKRLKIDEINTWSEQIRRTFYIKQWIKGDNIEWIFHNNTKEPFSFPKKDICN